ncbi:pantetheine-phosphate adenylyltransferase [Lactobacillus sp. LL6]|uniref:pantetheine-phosphate adenylyltransferase n=1 Tax=Lactobacillus sp. LL6 TaxID=2596827 RepID=UPI001185941C|nr:pantetheine-phosphate adenylyltransferase [Lactobacillus sp. LL6]TSO26194.1 pantetheine-phosphate adenylyltransferase [Lactobacillus sp. LL6]
MKIALFPGSYDPITNGHVSVAKKAAEIFDKVYVVVMTNTSKNYMFSSSERSHFAKDALKNIHNIEILERPEELTVNVAHELGASAIVRGVRNSDDFRYEQQIAGINEKLAPDIHTVLLFTDPEQSFVASSMLKEVAKFGGDVSKFLPDSVEKALTQKMRDINA